MKEALFYERKGNLAKCMLCPWFCMLKPGQTGICKVRRNVDGMLVTDVYNRVSALSADPIEKKPLYHFLPGKNILSLGGVGCNLHCSFCQNYHISQCSATDFQHFREITSEEIADKAAEVKNNIGVAYTYNEPFTFFEFMFETALLVKARGLKNVVVSNGYVNPEPLLKLLPLIDAFNIDLKALEDDFYRKHTKGKLQPVLDTLKIIAQSGKHLEITNLVIGGLNDDESQFEEMVKWIAGELGAHTPLHLSRYYPQYKLTLPSTPLEKLRALYFIAKRHLSYVYPGNVSDEEFSSTRCSKCNELLIARTRYTTRIVQKGFKGVCQKCGNPSHIVMD